MENFRFLKNFSLSKDIYVSTCVHLVIEHNSVGVQKSTPVFKWIKIKHKIK